MSAASSINHVTSSRAAAEPVSKLPFILIRCAVERTILTAEDAASEAARRSNKFREARYFLLAALGDAVSLEGNAMFLQNVECVDAACRRSRALMLFCDDKWKRQVGCVFRKIALVWEGEAGTQRKARSSFTEPDDLLMRYTMKIYFSCTGRI